MKKSWLVAISLALVLAVVGVGGCTAGPTEIGTVDISSQQEGIWVSGTGEVTAAPDIATLYLGIEAQAETVNQAQSEADEAMNAVMEALDDNGVDEKDIQTRYFSIDQITRWDDDEIIVIGYRVNNTVEVKIREIDNTGAIIDAVAAAGGDLTRINSISFSIDDATVYYEEAREEAMANAQAKAEQLADLAGVELGNPTYISEGTLYYPVDYRDAGMMVPEAEEGFITPISPGELELSLTVQVIYDIVD